ncbi:MAG: type VI secretion system ImpA family N-terminal domain-containing protein [Endozoicomonas sp. (ex Botrylloides leachii)]|nr:type VI secretion system ImpA family N-terminal domain-containing protein [Endozoicomonas sp. (ex Botrylloides leachii)]
MSDVASDEFTNILLTPFSEVNPSGIYLKSCPNVYRPIRNALTVAQTSLQELSFTPDPEKVETLVKINKDNWANLEKLITDALVNNAKDMELMAWLALAQLFSKDGYFRLAKVLGLIGKIMTTFWPHFQPWLPDEKIKSVDDDAIFKERVQLLVQPFNFLFGDSQAGCQIALALRILPLVDGVDYAFYLKHELASGIEDKALRESITNKKNELINQIKAMSHALLALNDLDGILREKFSSIGLQSPSSRFFREQLEANLIAIKNMTKGIVSPWPLDDQWREIKKEKEAGCSSASDSAELDDDAESGSKADTDNGRTIIKNRDIAFERLKVIAAFFLENEPQSPISYLLERAIRWGYTPLPDLIKELLEGHDNALESVAGMMCTIDSDKTTYFKQDEKRD